MSEPFIAEITIFGGNFAPRGWARCDGQLLPIAQNTALFSLIGTIYGGDGETTTALPDLRARAPMGTGRGPGLSTRVQGESGGSATATLTESTMPNHRHVAESVDASGDTNVPGPDVVPARPRGRGAALYSEADTTTNFGETSVTGGGAAHENRQPHLPLTFLIALTGLFPSPS